MADVEDWSEAAVLVREGEREARETADTSKQQMNPVQAETRAQTGGAGKGAADGRMAQAHVQQLC